MPKLLATRVLTSEERIQLERLGYKVDTIPSIEVELVDFEMPQGFSDVIFTSQNAIKSFLKHTESKELISRGIRAYCVGAKTYAAASDAGFEVCYWANNSEELALKISQSDADKSFVYFSGSISMRALVEGLDKDLINYKEIVVYQTFETQPKLKEDYDVLLFFSPSGVRSISALNDISKALKACIGPTTARELKGDNNILIADYPPSFDHMVEAIKQYKN